jgi:hypothetical protein
MVWDWKDVPSIEDLHNAIRKGFTWLYDIETGGDCYCWVASKTPLRKTQLHSISQAEFFE